MENDGTLPLPKNSHIITVCEKGKVTTEDNADIAVYVISRPSGGECTPADYELTEQEKQELNAVTTAYLKTVVLLCADRAVHTKYLRKQSGICAILLTRPEGNISNSAPACKLKKPMQDLAGFVHTKELSPGETEKVTVSFPLVSMASFDEERDAWVLEEGLYYIRVGNHSRNTHIAAALSVDGEVIVAKPSDGLPLDATISRMPAWNLGQYTYEGETREKEEAVVIDVITSTLKNNC